MIAQEKRFEFAIPAQALSSAIEAYSRATERDVLFNSNLTIGRRSMAVRGFLPADTALMVLLEGTGLSARYETSGSFVLLPASDAAVDEPTPRIAWFYGRLQASLRTSLCSTAEARPGSYRVAVRLWVSSDGKVTRFQRLSSTGMPDVDASLDISLEHLDIGAAPPLGLAQPITVVIAPQAPGLTMGCNRDAKAAP